MEDLPCAHSASSAAGVLHRRPGISPQVAIIRRVKILHQKPPQKLQVFKIFKIKLYEIYIIYMYYVYMLDI